MPDPRCPGCESGDAVIMMEPGEYACEYCAIVFDEEGENVRV